MFVYLVILLCPNWRIRKFGTSVVSALLPKLGMRVAAISCLFSVLRQFRVVKPTRQPGGKTN
jgi:hypothetical protein